MAARPREPVRQPIDVPRARKRSFASAKRCAENDKTPYTGQEDVSPADYKSLNPNHPRRTRAHCANASYLKCHEAPTVAPAGFRSWLRFDSLL